MDAINKCNSNEARNAAFASKSEGDDEMASSTRPHPPPPEVNLDHILSCVPYRDLLRDLFGSGGGGGENHNTSVPVVTKSYEVICIFVSVLSCLDT